MPQTNNYVQKYVGGSLTDSLIYDDGTNVGVGNATPGELLSLRSSTNPAIHFLGAEARLPGFD